ncbi:unnamed protein product [Gongylonema pulchrum]|uniref:BZIP domain-containing protein n=1 Tax=Gongylonema pulchrum TaxID=637853 RepID=A0A183E5J2_9BILA|nr:unnamed protein product [Gongylonema pulchrum]
MANSNSAKIESLSDLSEQLPCDSVEAPRRKKRHLHADERARLAYERIQAERKEQAEKRRVERESKRKALESYLSTKRKMNRALLRRNKKGQPNLNAQIEVLLEKIEKRTLKS